MRKRYTVTYHESIKGEDFKMYYSGGHWRYSADIKKAKGFYSKEKVEILLSDITKAGYGKGHIIELI